MKNYNVMTAILLLGLGACSSQEGTVSEDSQAASVTQAVTAQGTVNGPQRMNVKVKTTVQSAKGVKAPTPLSPEQLQSLGVAPRSKTTGSANAPTTTPTAYPDPAQAAAASLGTLAEVVASDEPAKRGFSSAAEVQSSSIADGMPVQFVRLDQLVAYKAGKDAKSLLLDTQEVMYPVTVGGDVRSSVTVQKRSDGQWQAAKFGNAPVARASQSARGSVMSKRTADKGTVSLVEIPTVGALLLSHTEKGVLMVTPVYDIPGTPLKAGKTRTAAEVFAQLQPIAAKVDPSVPN